MKRTNTMRAVSHTSPMAGGFRVDREIAKHTARHESAFERGAKEAEAIRVILAVTTDWAFRNACNERLADLGYSRGEATA